VSESGGAALAVVSAAQRLRSTDGATLLRVIALSCASTKAAEDSATRARLRPLATSVGTENAPAIRQSPSPALVRPSHSCRRGTFPTKFTISWQARTMANSCIKAASCVCPRLSSASAESRPAIATRANKTSRTRRRAQKR
jgi:hypothetical protein